MDENKKALLIILAFIAMYIAVCCMVFDSPKEMEEASYYFFQMSGRLALSGWQWN